MYKRQIQYRTVLIMFPLILQTIIIAQMFSDRGGGRCDGGNRNRLMPTWSLVEAGYSSEITGCASSTDSICANSSNNREHSFLATQHMHTCTHRHLKQPLSRFLCDNHLCHKHCQHNKAASLEMLTASCIKTPPHT